jgi:putative endonuclease
VGEGHLFGRRCEELSVAWLAGRGFRILARNFRTRRGEIDIIARHGDELVFVEVKAKRGDRLGAPLEMITPVKIGRIIAAALDYLAEASWRGRGCRFDVVTVSEGPGGEVSIDHLAGAFGLDDARPDSSRGRRTR